MKIGTAIAVVTMLSGVAAAYWTYRSIKARSGGVAIPPASQMYSAALPWGFVWSPSIGAYIKTDPSGHVEIFA